MNEYLASYRHSERLRAKKNITEGKKGKRTKLQQQQAGAARDPPLQRVANAGCR